MSQLFHSRKLQEQIVPAWLSSQREMGSSGERCVGRRIDISILSSLLSPQLCNTLHNGLGFCLNFETVKVS